MKRIRNVGIAALAVMSVAVTIGAGSASASALVSETAGTDFVGTGLNSILRFGPETSNISCSGTSASGYREGTKSQELKVTPGGGLCSFFGQLPLQWKGCQITYHLGPEISTGVFSGTVDLGPPTCGPITLEYPESPPCTMTLAPKTGLKAKFSNGGGTGTSRTVTASVEATNLKYARSGGLCGKGSGEGEGGVWTASWQLKGFKPGTQTQVGIYLEQTQGLQVTGVESAEKAKQPRFQNGIYPAAIVGGVSTTNKFTEDSEGIWAECGSGSLGPAAVFAASADLSIDASYGECKSILGKATVNMNSCHYIFHVANVGPPYSGSVDIACSKEGGAIEILFKDGSGTPICSTFFPAQKLGTASYEMVGTGESRKVIASVKGEGLKASREGSAICGPKTSTKGSFSGAFFLTGP